MTAACEYDRVKRLGRTVVQHSGCGIGILLKTSNLGPAAYVDARAFCSFKKKSKEGSPVNSDGIHVGMQIRVADVHHALAAGGVADQAVDPVTDLDKLSVEFEIPKGSNTNRLDQNARTHRGRGVEAFENGDFVAAARQMYRAGKARHPATNDANPKRVARGGQ